MSRLPGHSVDVQTPALRAAAKLADLERRVADLESGQYQSASAAISTWAAGPWVANGASITPTTGTSFTINHAGIYVFSVSVTAYATTANLFQSCGVFIDGVVREYARLFMNGTNDHKTMAPAVFSMYLSQGTHYYAIQHNTASMSSDIFDVATISAARIGS